MEFANAILLCLLFYACGLLGSIAATARRLADTPDNGAFFILLIVFVQVIVLWPLQICKVAMAAVCVYLVTQGTGVFWACVIAFASGFVAVTALPYLALLWGRISARRR